MNDSKNICLPCGFCCDGTLIGHVQLGKEELPALKELMDVEDERGNGFFIQPCSNYCDGCTIYSKRPKQCGNFECGLLKSYEQKELDFDSAIEIINDVKQKKEAIENKLATLPFELRSQSFYFKMVELKNIFKKQNTEAFLTQNQIELIADLEQLDSLISENFGVALY